VTKKSGPGRSFLSRQFTLNILRRFVQRFAQLAGILATGLGQVGTTTAAAAHHLGHRFDQLAGVQPALDQVIG